MKQAWEASRFVFVYSERESENMKKRVNAVLSD
jgi:hypothetical protein